MKSKPINLVKIIKVFCLVFLIASCDKKPKDGSGNKYDVIKIGDQCWLKQNLRTTKYNDGTPIHAFIQNDTNCHYNKIGWYANQGDPAHIKDSILYGKFYNWYAVNSGNLAPKGWHVATRADWDKLDKFLGKDAKGINANKLRTTKGWRDNNIGDGIDTYGFSAVPAGYKNFGDGYWKDSDGTQCTIFWTSTWDPKHICPDDGKSYPYSTLVSMGNSMLLKDQPWCEGFGCSVRCVKD